MLRARILSSSPQELVIGIPGEDRRTMITFDMEIVL